MKNMYIAEYCSCSKSAKPDPRQCSRLTISDHTIPIPLTYAPLMLLLSSSSMKYSMYHGRIASRSTRLNGLRKKLTSRCSRVWNTIGMSPSTMSSSTSLLSSSLPHGVARGQPGHVLDGEQEYADHLQQCELLPRLRLAVRVAIRRVAEVEHRAQHEAHAGHHDHRHHEDADHSTSPGSSVRRRWSGRCARWFTTSQKTRCPSIRTRTPTTPRCWIRPRRTPFSRSPCCRLGK